MYQTEATSPMNMGSPLTSPPPASGLNQSSFLPAYLMGDHSVAGTASPGMTGTSRLFSSPSLNQQSPNRSTNNRSFSATSPSATVNNSVLQTSMADIRTRHKEKAGAPPVQSLLESASSSPQVSNMSKLRNQSDFLGNNVRQTPSLALGTPRPSFMSLGPETPAQSQTNLSTVPAKTPPSPAQMDPFYTQGERLTADDELDETWVTVFGFPPAATSFILQQFSQYGAIVKHVIATDGNWMHLRYQSKIQAKKALSKNGKIYSSSVMIGVSPCVDKEVMDAEKENQSNTTRHSLYNTPNDSMKGTPIRPLNAAYRAAAQDFQVLRSDQAPKKSTNLMSKAMEYVFGW